MQPQNVGLILGVTPRISPDGLVVMQIDAEKSALESEATGIPIFASTGGTVIRSPIIDTTVAQTTVSAMSEQTVVLGGLIAKTKNESHRKVPLLGDVPLLGHLFRYDSTTNSQNRIADHHDAAHRQERGRRRRDQAGRSGADELVPLRRDRDLRRGGPAKTNRQLVRRGDQGDLPRLEIRAGFAAARKGRRRAGSHACRHAGPSTDDRAAVGQSAGSAAIARPGGDRTRVRCDSPDPSVERRFGAERLRRRKPVAGG